MSKASPNSGDRVSGARVPSAILMAAGCLVVVFLILLCPKHETPAPRNRVAQKQVTARESVPISGPSRDFSARRGPDSTSLSEPAKTPEQIVAEKVKVLGRKRRELARQVARRQNRGLTPEAEAFFDALEAGNWDEIHARWKALADRSGQYAAAAESKENMARDPDWSAILDAYGVAEQAHMWPAQKLLDYGQAVLGSLRPGMIYLGGTDPGRWVPELLNETGEAEQHIIITQNALADGTYLDFVTSLYGDQIATLTADDSQRAFQDYLADAQKRLEHDQQFPDEPKQVRPGENISNQDGHVQVSGAVAVMSINEKLVQALMQKNPGLSFAMEKSSPLKGLYADAAPLGPLLELTASSGQTEFTKDRAAEALNYWRSATDNLLADPEAAGSESTLKTWAHEASAAANVLTAHGFSAEAEQAYRYSAQLWPACPEAVTGLAEILAGTGRPAEAKQLLDDFARTHPDHRSMIEKVRSTLTFSAK